ncbi:MJ0042-type zinc finger domain-containing protein [Hyphobacterium sp. HN65]|uniref:MJ0042-type zinc finger domain-containing protein n=1 Tax=Hyphobacterium lacteum TaxID=3116575 RepID=A0ABU7LRQ0_9PROT|nr:MJ0042-type zinc finger domain-containing protein [Hyphobacterium sp. HN65]MEE2526004.1 MJ0042-type zinc finger domain-containing protein [Hyphobacterium sp. HN65]
MILSCPSCETRYRANPSAIGMNGRRVKCAACGHIWTARNEEEPVLEPIDPIPPKPEPEPVAEEPVRKAPHRAFRERAEQRRQEQIRKAAAGAWGGLAVAIAGVFAVGFLFRADIVSAWPQASSAYAAVGIEANAYGVMIESLEIERGEEHGIPTVVLTGEIRNIDRQARMAPALQGRLLSQSGQPVLEWTVVVDGDIMAPGERRAFRSVVTDPPENASEAEVSLAGLDVSYERGEPALDESHEEIAATSDAHH